MNEAHCASKAFSPPFFAMFGSPLCLLSPVCTALERSSSQMSPNPSVVPITFLPNSRVWGRLFRTFPKLSRAPWQEFPFLLQGFSKLKGCVYDPSTFLVQVFRPPVPGTHTQEGCGGCRAGHWIPVIPLPPLGLPSSFTAATSSSSRTQSCSPNPSPTQCSPEGLTELPSWSCHIPA